MPAIPTTPLIYIDTNGILSAKEYGERGTAIGDSTYRTRGRRYEQLFDVCAAKGFRVATLMFTLAEMLSKYQQWHYYEWKIRERVPFDEIFGSTRKEHQDSFFTPTNLASIAAGVETWLTTWRFRSLVELYPPNDPTAFGAWSVEFWEVTRIIFKHAPISAPDCIHATAAVVMGADLFVSNDEGLNKAIRQMYDTPDFGAEVAPVLGLQATDITLPHGALTVQKALNVVGRLR